MILTIVKTQKGYCQQCQKPKKVAEIRLAEHDYSFLICSACLDELGSQANNGAKVFVENKQVVN